MDSIGPEGLAEASPYRARSAGTSNDGHTRPEAYAEELDSENVKGRDGSLSGVVRTGYRSRWVKVVTFPDFGYGVTQGETDREATEIARDLLMLTISDFLRAGKSLPVATRRSGSKFRPVALPALQCAKVDLYSAFLEAGLKKAEFARASEYPRLISIVCFRFAITPASTRSNWR